jgi:hypothetical protein
MTLGLVYDADDLFSSSGQPQALEGRFARRRFLCHPSGSFFQASWTVTRWNVCPMNPTTKASRFQDGTIFSKPDRSFCIDGPE